MAKETRKGRIKPQPTKVGSEYVPGGVFDQPPQHPLQGKHPVFDTDHKKPFDPSQVLAPVVRRRRVS